MSIRRKIFFIVGQVVLLMEYEVSFMKLGNVSETILRRSVLKQLDYKEMEVLVAAGVGKDCAIVDMGKEDCCALSTNTLTYYKKGMAGLLVYNLVNNLATKGAVCIALQVSILLPERAREIQLKEIVEEVRSACKVCFVSMTGGSTEVSNNVTRPILSATGVGKLDKGDRLLKSQVEVNQDLVMTKWVGLQGTALLAKLDEERLKGRFSARLVEKAKSLDRYTSVLPEALIGKKCEVSAMHDLSKGGIFQGLWQLVRDSSFGLEVDLKKIPILQETVEVCEYYHINPYELDSGGALLIATYNGRELVAHLEAEGIASAIIGQTRAGNDKIILNDGQRRCLEAPKCDEFYKAMVQIER